MTHPCGNVPVSTIVAMLHYCHHHQAWFARVERRLQDGDDVEVVALAQMQFGPFDRMVEVEEWLHETLGGLLALPGVPWAS